MMQPLGPGLAIIGTKDPNRSQMADDRLEYSICKVMHVHLHIDCFPAGCNKSKHKNGVRAESES